MIFYPDILARAQFRQVTRLAKWLGVVPPKRVRGQGAAEYRSLVRGLVWQAMTAEIGWRATPLPDEPKK